MGCCPNKELPSLLAMAGEAAKSGGRIVAGKLRGEPVRVSPEVEAARMAHCLECELCLSVPHENGRIFHRCKECGCWLDGVYAAKARFAAMFCPLRKWEAVK